MTTIIFSPCTACKDDEEVIKQGSKVVEPFGYLHNFDLLRNLLDTRKRVFNIPGVQRGDKTTYAFDLYVRSGKTYNAIYSKHYDSLKRKLLADDALQWFFLSGGYGVIHALEKAKNYQASFIRLPKDKHVPYTGTIWRNAGLHTICDAIINRFKPSRIYVFGSRNYSVFVRQAVFDSDNAKVKIFESKGNSGSFWLSPKLEALTEAILNGNLDDFDKKHPDKEYKQSHGVS